MHTTTTLLALTGATLALANPAPAPLVTPAPVLHPAAARLATRQFDGDPVFSDLNPAELSKSLECARQYASLAHEAPRESNHALASWLVTVVAQNAVTAAETIADSLTTLCDPSVTATLTPPASLSSAWSTYQSKSTSWISSAASEAHSIASSCGGEISAVAELLVISDSESCTKAVLGIVAALNGDEGVTTSGTVTTGSASQTTGAAGESETGSAGGDGDSQDGDGDSGETSAAGAGATETTSTSTGGVPRETGMMGVAAAAAIAVAGVVAAL
ncbi:hypothetical protein C8A01DRAFT_35870 [Parachaetomium inaequale]|uniref:Infection structure specific protein n=1 Tax=Parachaetomium inaequale TaxID=2588326 RepID=A0AAN6PKE6_9PEZI|nr:hypothetical protein C8A01DRAFT_35870 [Parachaetomium inaequale]